MIVLLSCFTNLSVSSFCVNSSTGGLQQDSIRNDSVLISYYDLRKVNSKLVELDYEKEINKNLRNIIINDSVAINNLIGRIDNMDRYYNKKLSRVKKERNIAGGIGIVSIVLLIISIL